MFGLDTEPQENDQKGSEVGYPDCNAFAMDTSLMIVQSRQESNKGTVGG